MTEKKPAEMSSDSDRYAIECVAIPGAYFVLTETQNSGPPPYDVPANQGTTSYDLSPRRRNSILVSRTIGALKGIRFTVDPNLHLPASLLDNPRRPHLSKAPKPNLELAVDFGAIDADIDVLPFTSQGNTAAVDAGGASDNNSDISTLLPSRGEKVSLRATTKSGNITLRVRAPPTASMSLHAESSFGHLRIFLPRTLHGPLSVSTALRAARLSPELLRVCTPLIEIDGTARWFIGDVAAWSANGERGDEVRLRSEFGLLWVGYVGEEEEAERALGSLWDPAKVVWSVVKIVVICGASKLGLMLFEEFCRWAF